VVTDDGAREHRGNPLKRFWSRLLALLVVVGVGCLITEVWWSAAATVVVIIFAARQRRIAPDKPP
jgi:hypothetical protein